MCGGGEGGGMVHGSVLMVFKCRFYFNCWINKKLVNSINCVPLRSLCRLLLVQIPKMVTAPGRAKK